jgi:hypothetical protein
MAARTGSGSGLGRTSRVVGGHGSNRARLCS